MKKITAWLVLSVFLCGTVFAEEKLFSISSFEKGLNDHISDWLTPDNQSITSENVRYNEEFGPVTKRPALKYFGSIGTTSVSSLFRFYTSDGARILIASGGDSIAYGDDETGAFVTIRENLTDGKSFSYVNYQNMLIAMNGVDRPLKWDGWTQTTANTEGSRTASNLAADAGAPFAELLTVDTDEGAGLTAEKWYQYKVVFKASGLYYYSYARSNPIQTGTTVASIKLTDIPLGPTGTTERRIYRTMAQDTQNDAETETIFEYVATIQDNTTQTYEDHASDASITSIDPGVEWTAYLTTGYDATPPLGTIAETYKEKLFISGNLTDKCDIYWSDTYNPDFFYPTSYLQVRPDDGGKITFLKTFLSILTVGKNTSIQKLYTNSSDESQWELSEPFSYVGAIAPRSAASTPKGIFYLGRDGIYAFTGQSSELISDAVTPNIRGIVVSRFEAATGIYYKNVYYLAYTSDESTGAANDRILSFDLIRDAYTIDLLTINSFATLDSGIDFGSLAFGSGTTDGKVYIYDGKEYDGTSFFTQVAKYQKAFFTAGTKTDTWVWGGTYTPEIELAWTITIDEGVGTINGHTYGTPEGSAIIDRPDKEGIYITPIIEINAASLSALFWNERLNTTGDVTFYVRTGDTSGEVAAAAWEGPYSDPNYNDISDVDGKKYVQVKMELETTLLTNTPEIFVADGYLLRITYAKTDAYVESGYTSTWESGWKNLGAPGVKKTIKRIRVFYQGTSGTLSVNYTNDDGDVNETFDIDLSQTVPADADGDKHYEYKGRGDHKIYTFFPAINSPTENVAVGESFKFKVYDKTASNAGWAIDRIEVLCDTNPILD